MTGRMKRNLAVAAVLATLFGAGLILVLRPVLGVEQSADDGSPPTAQGTNGIPGTAPSANGSGTSAPNGTAFALPSGSSGVTQPGGNSRPPTKSVRVGGATLDNYYPAFGVEPCNMVGNMRATVPVRIVSINVSPAGPFDLRSCYQLVSGVEDVRPCAAGVVLPPPGQHPSRACGFYAAQKTLGVQPGTVTITSEAVCTSRVGFPCNRLTAEAPSPSNPITAILEDQFDVGTASTGYPTSGSPRTTAAITGPTTPAVTTTTPDVSNSVETPGATETP